MSPLLRIREAQVELAERIREFVRSKKESWQKVPIVALMADGRTGYRDQYRFAYESGYWNLGGYASAVDLATGELITLHGVVGTMNPTLSSDDHVIQYAANLDDLDAESILATLREEAEKSHSERYDVDEQIAWRAGIRTRYGVGAPYSGECRVLPKRDVIF